MSAKKLDPELWESIKRRYTRSSKMGGEGWNARKAQLAVLEYKRCGGRYGTSVPRAKTSLHKWTDENWQYVSGNTGRYLPEKVIRSMTNKEKVTENRKKRNAKTKRVKYSDSVTKKMHAHHVF